MTNRFGKVDFHMHSTVSDGTDTPAELLACVKAAGISTFSITDHDSVRAAGILKDRLPGAGLRYIPGVEFSCRDEEGKYHILGYNFDPDHPALNAVLTRGHQYRVDKVRIRLDFLRREFGFSFTEEDEAELFAAENPGKPHIARLMIRHGYAKTIQEAMQQYLNRAHTGIPSVRPEEAIACVLQSGGIPVLAHPFYGSGSELILGEQMEYRLTRLMEMGLRGVEAFYSGFSEKMRNEMLTLAERYHLFVTAGSDYHGTNKLVKLGDTGLDETDEYPAGLIRFLETVAGEL